MSDGDSTQSGQPTVHEPWGTPIGDPQPAPVPVAAPTQTAADVAAAYTRRRERLRTLLGALVAWPVLAAGLLVGGLHHDDTARAFELGALLSVGASIAVQPRRPVRDRIVWVRVLVALVAGLPAVGLVVVVFATPFNVLGMDAVERAVPVSLLTAYPIALAAGQCWREQARGGNVDKWKVR